ncbi:MAG: hypothetical protein ACXV3D_07745, partial [Halobacteriota archaeon]
MATAHAERELPVEEVVELRKRLKDIDVEKHAYSTRIEHLNAERMKKHSERDKLLKRSQALKQLLTRWQKGPICGMLWGLRKTWKRKAAETERSAADRRHQREFKIK